MALKQCWGECEEWWDEKYFDRRKRTKGIDASMPERRSICRFCERTRRDNRKFVNRWPTKIRDTIRRHALGLGKTAQQLKEDFGWNPQRMIQEAIRAYANGCVYCERPYNATDGGLLNDITLDIVDPERPPHYLVNTKWCCNSCNRTKSCMSPEEWAEYRIMWARHKRAIERGRSQRSLFP